MFLARLLFSVIVEMSLIKKRSVMNGYYHRLSIQERRGHSFVWEKDDVIPYRTLTVGWNALRPIKGQYHISISLKLKEWTPWFSYALWTTKSQRSFAQNSTSFQILQDVVHITHEPGATGWRVKVEAEDSSNLKEFHALYVSTPGPAQNPEHPFSDVFLDVQGLSQMQIRDPRNSRLCSPTSTTAVIHFLNKSSFLTPLQFADHVWDHHFDIYGHWVFAAAQAYAELGGEWEVTVQYLNGFKAVHDLLLAGLPLVVSIQGPLQGAIQAYDQGHLLVVRGFDSKQNKVLCMDPAYPTDFQTHVSYALEDFLRSWQRRKNIAYIFKRRLHGVDIPIG